MPHATSGERGRRDKATGPCFRGRGVWPHMTFELVDDPGAAKACRVAQRLALLLHESMAADGCSMRRLARESGVDVSTVKSVLDGTYGPRLDTAVRLLVARGIPLTQLTSDGPTTVDLGERPTSARTIRLPEQARFVAPASEPDRG